MIEPSVVLAAVTVNVRCVPGAGRGPPFGTKYRPAMPVCPAGTVTRLALVWRVNPGGTPVTDRLKVSTAGPRLRTLARNAVGTWAPLYGTVNRASGCTARLTPGAVGVTVTSTVAWATSPGLPADRTTTRTG